MTDAHTTLDGRSTTVLKHRAVAILNDVLEQIRHRKPDCVLFGGDNIDNRGAAERDLAAFERLVEPLNDWRYVVGNHEASRPKPGRITKAEFQRQFAGNGIPPDAPGYSHVVGDVRVIGLDTTMVGAPGGLVPADGVAFLKDALKAATEPHVVVVGHHLLVPCWRYPFDTWHQDYLVQNHQDVVTILGQYPQVRAYLCGHHHAHRITTVDTGEHPFYQVMTGSPVAFPHSARVLTFEHDAMCVETIRPRDTSVLEEGRQAVLLGRKAQRFTELGIFDEFLGYLEGDASESEVILPYTHAEPDRRAISAVSR
ncbi:MAG: metallophosphoesterase [Myxococcota bacterium]